MKTLSYSEVINRLKGTNYNINFHCGTYAIYNAKELAEYYSADFIASGRTANAAYKKFLKYPATL